MRGDCSKISILAVVAVPAGELPMPPHFRVDVSPFGRKDNYGFLH
jgi:hypothetical protein